MTNDSQSSGPQPTTRRRHISKKRKLLYLAIVVLLMLLACESALRVRAWMKYGSPTASVTGSMIVYDADLDLRIPRPGYEQVGQNISIRINSLGFRGDEISRQKPPNTVRIVCLGASTTFCAEVSSNEAAWPHRLQQGLQQRFPDIRVEVVNAAVPGYTASSNLKNLRERVLRLEPDLAIYYEATNDITQDTRELARERGLIATTQRNRSAAAEWLSKWSLLFDLIHKNASIALAQADKKAAKLEGIPKDVSGRFIAELDTIRRELESHGVPLVLSTFLTKCRRDQPRSVQLANADVAFFYMPWMTIDDLLDALDNYNEAIAQYATSHGLPVLEDRTSVPGDSEHYVDYVHMTDKGCAAMADRFLRFFDERKLIEQLIARQKAAN
ncbi:MAG: SGNH/GDSL hydrolase family protein [Planctomycetaceae bacterium]